jgi:RNA polymerase sigma-70 factor (ECF subfamily)
MEAFPNEVSVDSKETERLLERVRAGETEAFDQLFARYRGALRRIVRLQLDPVLNARIDASDVVQETQCEAARRMMDYLDREPMPFGVWLRKMAHERLLNLRRRHVGAQRRAARREVSLPDRTSLRIAGELLDGGTTPSQQLGRRERARQVRRAVSALPVADRQILLMRYFEGLSYKEVGYILDIDPATAMKRHGRAVLRLHKLLREAGLTESQL